ACEIAEAELVDDLDPEGHPWDFARVAVLSHRVDRAEEQCPRSGLEGFNNRLQVRPEGPSCKGVGWVVPLVLRQLAFQGRAVTWAVSRLCLKPLTASVS